MLETCLKRGFTVLTSIVAMLAFTVPAVAQGGTVSVTVIDRTNARLINGARVVLENTRITGRTDGRGEVTLDNITPGTVKTSIATMLVKTVKPRFKQVSNIPPCLLQKDRPRERGEAALLDVKTAQKSARILPTNSTHARELCV